MQTDPIKSKIQELVPEVMDTMLFESDTGWQYGYKSGTNYYWSNSHATKEEAHLAAITAGRYFEKDLTLAVVLRAINGEKNTGTDHLSEYEATNALVELIDLWLKSPDNYDEQSKETKEFIGSLLGV